MDRSVLRVLLARDRWLVKTSRSFKAVVTYAIRACTAP